MRAPPMPSFYLNHLYKDPIPKYRYILRYWGVKASTYEFGGNTIQPITSFNNYSFTYIFQFKAYNHPVSGASKAVPIVQIKKLRLREMQ